MDKKVIVLGTCHYNTIGVVQCLGSEGLDVIVVCVGNPGLLSKSIFAKNIYEFDNFDDAIGFIANSLTGDGQKVIIPCGDEAALKLEDNRNVLKENYLFQYVLPPGNLSIAMNKQNQVRIARECGINVPISYEVSTHNQPCDMVFPCIIKPLLSCEGDKRDICIVHNKAEYKNTLESFLDHTPRVIVQQFIEKRYKELNILGCSFKDGTFDIPLCIEKIRIHPNNTGSVSVGKVMPICDMLLPLKSKMEKMIHKIGYVGLFSFEFIIDSRKDVYFIELNLRNDALNPFIVKGGVNLPYLHVQDLLGITHKKYNVTTKTKKMICEPIHMASVYRGTISPIKWLIDILTSSSYMLYYRKDWRLFLNLFTRKFHH